MLSKPLTFFTLATAGALTFTPAVEADDHDHGTHGGDIVVGITGPTLGQANKLAFEGDFAEPIHLFWTTGLLEGWTESTPGFDALPADEPDELFFALGDGAELWLEIVAIAEGLSVVAPNFSTIADAPEERVSLGGSGLHTHPTWWAAFDDTWTGTLQATFRLVDLGSTGYADSDPFTLTFTNTPEPASLALMGVGAALMLRRRSNA